MYLGQLPIPGLLVDVVFESGKPFVRDWRDQDDSRRAAFAVLRLLVHREVCVEVFLERRQPGLAVEGLIQTEERDDDVGFLILQVCGSVAKVERPRLHGDRVATPAEIADHKVEVREASHQHRLEIVELLKPLGHRVAEEDDVVALAKLERRALGANARHERQRGQNDDRHERWMLTHGESSVEWKWPHHTRRSGSSQLEPIGAVAVFRLGLGGPEGPPPRVGTHSLYLAIVSVEGGGVTSDTTAIRAQEMNVIGTTGIRPPQASAPGTRAV